MISIVHVLLTIPLLRVERTVRHAAHADRKLQLDAFALVQLDVNG